MIPTHQPNLEMTDVAVVIPHFQRQPGLLLRALRSVFSQTAADRICIVVCDDASPISASQEIDNLTDAERARVKLVQQTNKGAGAARNNALDNLPAGIQYVAFLDADDAWRPAHIENALYALGLGFDAYFSNFIGVGYPDIGHFERVGSLSLHAHPCLDESRKVHALGTSALAHTVVDGGGLIGTSNVVYRFHKYPHLRFREEFYNGQDFFFWMDLSELQARFAFCYDIECDNGEGINIYQSSGWGTEKSLQRLRNELFVWTSVERFYELSPDLARANQRTIRNLQESFGKEIVHRLRHRKAIPGALVKDILRMAPSTWGRAPLGIVKAVLAKTRR